MKFRKPKLTIECWRAVANGRTYWHAKHRNGKIVADGSLATPSNVRRMAATAYPKAPVVYEGVCSTSVGRFTFIPE